MGHSWAESRSANPSDQITSCSFVTFYISAISNVTNGHELILQPYKHPQSYFSNLHELLRLFVTFNNVTVQWKPHISNMSSFHKQRITIPFLALIQCFFQIIKWLNASFGLKTHKGTLSPLFKNHHFLLACFSLEIMYNVGFLDLWLSLINATQVSLI